MHIQFYICDFKWHGNNQGEKKNKCPSGLSYGKQAANSGLQWHFPHMQNHAKGKYSGGGIQTPYQNMAASVMSSHSKAFPKCDWTPAMQGSLWLVRSPLNQELTSMTSIVHWVRSSRLGGQCSYINIKWNKMPRMCVNRDTASTCLYSSF